MLNFAKIIELHLKHITMDYFGDLFFIAMIIFFIVGSWLTAKTQKALGKGSTASPAPENKEKPDEVPAPVQDIPAAPVPVPPVSDVSPSFAPHHAPSHHTPPHHSSQLKEKQADGTRLHAPEETPGSPLSLDADELKKAVIYSEILHRKYS